MPSFRFCVLGDLSVSFHPTLLHSHSCSASARLAFSPFGIFRFSVLPFFSTFFRPLLFRVRLLSLPFLLFPLLLLPHGGSKALFFPQSLPSVSILPFPLWYSAFPAFSFLRSLFRITGATSAAGLLFPARPFPLAFALGSGYLADAFAPSKLNIELYFRNRVWSTLSLL